MKKRIDEDEEEVLHLRGSEAYSISEWLTLVLEERKVRNPKYSLRAFAQHLDLSPAQLSLILSGKRPVRRSCLDWFAWAF